MVNNLKGPEETAAEVLFFFFFIKGRWLPRTHSLILKSSEDGSFSGETKHCHRTTWTRRWKRVGPSFTQRNKHLRAIVTFYAPNSKQTPGRSKCIIYLFMFRFFQAPRPTTPKLTFGNHSCWKSCVLFRNFNIDFRFSGGGCAEQLVYFR